MPLPKAPQKRGDRVDGKASKEQARPRAAAPRGQAALLTSASAAEPETRHTKKEAAARKPAADRSEAARTRTEAQRQKTSAPSAQAAQSTQSAVNAPSTDPKADKAKAGRRPTPRRLYVLDTNVLLHDPTALFRFKEHDIYLPMVVLEELDDHKIGTSEVARNGRQTSRFLDALIASSGNSKANGSIALQATGFSDATGKLYFQTERFEDKRLTALPPGKADNRILEVVSGMQQREKKREVVLVSKDINMRIKARALGLSAEDYESDKSLDDGDLLYSGALALGDDFWTRQGKKIESWQQGSETFYKLARTAIPAPFINQFVYFAKPDAPSLLARVNAIQDKHITLKTIRDFSHKKNAVWGIMARNREQNFALNLLLDPDVDFVTLAGMAGTGKTLLALAAGLTQVLDERRYSEIIMTRATVNLAQDIGFLPGTEEEKMSPWMGALDDNLEFLAHGDSDGSGSWGRSATNDLIRSRIKIKSINFMRGRTFQKKWVIVDEAQNLTPKQMKALITRAGPGTKMICLGNLGQIDTPYLTEGSSGLAYVVGRFKDWEHSGHVTLQRGERSRLAEFASDAL